MEFLAEEMPKCLQFPCQTSVPSAKSEVNPCLSALFTVPSRLSRRPWCQTWANRENRGLLRSLRFLILNQFGCFTVPWNSWNGINVSRAKLPFSAFFVSFCGKILSLAAFRARAGNGK